jgi:hypothetical protein
MCQPPVPYGKGKQKKALFHKNPKEKYKPHNQTMTDDSDDKGVIY